MLEKLKRGRRKYGLSRYLSREMNHAIDKWLSRSSKQSLVKLFELLGVRGKTVCVHASLSRLGYIEGGADTVIDALIESVGPDGCIVMPAFSLRSTMKQYIDQGEVFDVHNTPSNVGTIAEVFRCREGVLRSLHPTNSLTALGVGAAELLRGHEDSLTPYGFATPYGKLAERDDACILMLNTHVHSLLHHIQERVDFPNLFLAEQAEVRFIDANGSKRTMTTKIMRPRLPYFVAIPSVAGEEPDWAILHDFALMFPSHRETVVRQLGYRFDGFKSLYSRRRRLIKDGILTTQSVGRGEIGLLKAAQFVRAVQPDFEESIERFRRYYSLEYLTERKLTYG